MGRGRLERLPYKVRFQRATEKGVLFEMEDYKEIWFPRSEVECGSDIDELSPDEETEITIPRWLAEEKEIDI